MLRVLTVIWFVGSLFWGLSLQADECGSISNAYGPYDYTNPEDKADKLPIVEKFHFTEQIEQLKGHQRSIAGDLDYTLRAFPNHHRALIAMTNLQLSYPPGSKVPYRTIRCYFERALRFKPDDVIVHMLYGSYLFRKGDLTEALKRYRDAEAIDPNFSELQYNIGLLLVEMKNFSEAKKYADLAYGSGYPLAGLRNKLKQAGKW